MSMLSLINRLDSAAYNLTISGCRGQAAARRRLVKCQQTLMRFTRKYLSADGLHKTVKHSLLREQFKVIKNSEYNWQDCIMSGLAVFGFKMPSLLQFEKDKASEPWI